MRVAASHIPSQILVSEAVEVCAKYQQPAAMGSLISSRGVSNKMDSEYLDDDVVDETLMQQFSLWFRANRPDVNQANIGLFYHGHCLVHLSLHAARRVKEQEPEEPVWREYTGLTDRVATEMLTLMKLNINLEHLKLHIRRWSQPQSFLAHAFEHDPSCLLLPAPQPVKDIPDKMERISLDAMCSLAVYVRQKCYLARASEAARPESAREEQQNEARRRRIANRRYRAFARRVEKRRNVFLRRFRVPAIIAASFISFVGVMFLFNAYNAYRAL